MDDQMTIRLILLIVIAVQLSTSIGCSTLGLTLWPGQLPMLQKAKQFAAASRTSAGMKTELSKQALLDYYIEPGDRLLLEPVKLDSEFQSTGDQQVMVDGSIDLGKFGRLRVAGMTVEEVESLITRRIAEMEGEAEIVNVQLTETNASKVYVLGAVGSPGTYDLKGRETVLDAILLAGGLTSKASPCNIIFVRPTGPCECRFVQRICFRQITQLGDTTTNYQLQPGDRIVVSERTLREEIAFWRQATACPCCDRSNCVEKSPELINYGNRFSGWLPNFAAEHGNPQNELQPETSTASTYEAPASVDGEDPAKLNSADEKFFIPENENN
jgi:polysaccharide export outer membrane protein